MYLSEQIDSQFRYHSVCFVILIVGFRVVAHWGNRERARKTRITARRPRTALELERAASRASVDSAETLVERSPGHFVTLPQPPPQAHVQQR